MKHVIILFLFIILSTLTRAQVVLDGSLGPAGALKGPEFQIEFHLGQQRGDNLFHSFETFNLTPEQTAIFTGPEHIRHVLSRVSGGHPSFINGGLSVQMPQADFYFLNPAGVVFGDQAWIDVPGSFYVSSADYLKLGASGRFDATTAENSLLTVASPSAFGFLQAPAGTLQVNGSWLFLPNDDKWERTWMGEEVPRSTLAFIGGDITLKDSVLLTLGGDAHFVSVASAGEVPVDATQLTDDSFRAWGQLHLFDTTAHAEALVEGYGNIDVSGRGGGQIYIQAGNIILDDGWIFADTWGDKAGRGITIRAQEQLVLNHAARITTEAYPKKSFDMPIFPQTTGQGGAIYIQAGDITLTGGSQINSSTQTNSRAGDITLSAREHFFLSDSDSSGFFDSGVFSQTLGQGDGGQVNISASRLTLDNHAVITTKTDELGVGDAGNLSIQVDTLEVFNGAQIDVSAAQNPQVNQHGQGHAGDLNIIAHEAVHISGASAVKGPSSLLSNTLNQGQGGTVKVVTPVLTLEHGGSIESATAQGGDAGSIVLRVNSLKLSGDSKIDTKTVGSGQAGDIDIIAQEALLIENAHISLITEGKGPGGHAEIKTRYLKMTEGGVITAESLDQGDAGHMVLIVGDQLIAHNSAIETSTQGADGGNITVTSSSYLYLVNSKITTSVKTQSGDGGNITLNPEFIIFGDNSYILAQAVKGHGGDIDITTSGIYSFSEQPLTELINATSERSVDGVITISSPEGERVENLIVLSADFFDAAQLLNGRCEKLTFEDIEKYNRFVVLPDVVRGNQPDNVYRSGNLSAPLSF